MRLGKPAIRESKNGHPTCVRGSVTTRNVMGTVTFQLIGKGRILAESTELLQPLGSITGGFSAWTDLPIPSDVDLETDELEVAVRGPGMLAPMRESVSN